MYCLLATILVGPSVQSLTADPDGRGGRRHHGKGKHREKWQEIENNLKELKELRGQFGRPGKAYEVPNDIKEMGPYVKKAVAYVEDLDPSSIDKRNLNNRQDEVMNLASQLAAELLLYQDMLNADDPGFRSQETRVRSFFGNFKNKYIRFVEAVVEASRSTEVSYPEPTWPGSPFYPESNAE